MKYGSALRRGTVTRVQAAIEKDPNIIASSETLPEHPGSALEYLESLGLKESDLKRMERYGLAVRGYTKNIWLPGEKLPNGKTQAGDMIKTSTTRKVPYELSNGYVRYLKEEVDASYPSVTGRGRGHRVRWLLIAPKEETVASGT